MGTVRIHHCLVMVVNEFVVWHNYFRVDCMFGLGQKYELHGVY